MTEKYTDEERAAAEFIGTTPEDLDLAFAGAQAAGERKGLEPLILAYADARNAREEADAETKRLRKIEEEHETALFDRMEQQGLRSVRHARGLFSLNDMAWPKIVDRQAATDWALQERPELITLNTSSLGPVVREALKVGDPYPPGIDVSLKRNITWRRS